MPKEEVSEYDFLCFVVILDDPGDNTSERRKDIGMQMSKAFTTFAATSEDFKFPATFAYSGDATPAPEEIGGDDLRG